MPWNRVIQPDRIRFDSDEIAVSMEGDDSGDTAVAMFTNPELTISIIEHTDTDTTTLMFNTLRAAHAVALPLSVTELESALAAASFAFHHRGSDD